MMEYDEYEYLRESALASLWKVEAEDEMLKEEVRMFVKPKRRKVFLTRKAYIWKKRSTYEEKTLAFYNRKDSPMPG